MVEREAGGERQGWHQRAVPGQWRRKWRTGPGPGPVLGAAVGTAAASDAGSAVAQSQIEFVAEVAAVEPVGGFVADVEGVAVAAAVDEAVVFDGTVAAESEAAGCAAAVDCVVVDDLVVGGFAAAAVVAAAVGTVSVAVVWRCPPVAWRVQWVQAPEWASDLGPAGSMGKRIRSEAMR